MNSTTTHDREFKKQLPSDFLFKFGKYMDKELIDYSREIRQGLYEITRDYLKSHGLV